MTAALRACLEHETTLVQAFIQAAGAETQALANRHAHDALRDAAQQKETLAYQLAACGPRRDALLAELGLPPGHDGTQIAARQFPHIEAAWQRLSEQIQLARRHNVRNGALIATQLRDTQASIQAIARIVQHSAPTTYDAQGRGPGRASSGRRTIAAA